MEEPKIFLATPLSKEGKLNIEVADFCAYLDKRKNVIRGYIKTGSPEMSRNGLIEDGLHKDWTHILLNDSDVAPPIYALDKLLELNASVAVGICPLYLSGSMYWNVSIDGKYWIPMHEKLPKEPFDIQAAGAGLLLIRREVLTDIGWPYFQTVYQPKYENEGSTIKTGEDIWFCKRAREEGHKIIAHPLVECGHHNPVELLKIYKAIKLQVETKRVKPAKV